MLHIITNQILEIGAGVVFLWASVITVFFIFEKKGGKKC